MPVPILEGLRVAVTFPPSYLLADDGERFIILSDEDESNADDLETGDNVLNVVENWFEELRRLAPPDPQ